MRPNRYKMILLLLIAVLISSVSFAQKIKSRYEPWFMQFSLRAGLLNFCVTGEFKLSPKLNLGVDMGYGFNFLMAEGEYDKYNRNYANYYIRRSTLLDFGDAWWSWYTSLNLRRTFGNKTKIIYNNAYANTFGYYGLQLKCTTWQTNEPVSGKQVNRYRETYRLSFIVGRQLEIIPDGRILFDIYTGFGFIANYRIEAFKPSGFITFRLGANVWRKKP